MANNNLIEVNNLSIKFKTEDGYNKGVNQISFALQRGEVLGIVGESGSGKSVSSLAIMGLLQSPPAVFESGEILFQKKDGQVVDLLKLDENEKRKFRGNEVAMIFQEPMTSLNPVKKCGPQVAEALMLHLKMPKTEAHKRVIELFEEVKLPRPEKIFESYPHEISGGQKQRVMIAMAISCKPSLLIADEPTTALDVTIQKKILEIIIDLKDKYQMAVIFITHDLGVIAQIAKRVVVMFRGEKIEESTVEDIFRKSKHPYTKGLIASRPPLNKRFVTLPTVADFINEDFSVREKDFEYDEITSQQRLQAQSQLYSTEPILRIENLDTTYVTKRSVFGKVKSSFKAVDSVSLQVFKGETLGLVGESGCGKTTLGRTMIRMIEASSGDIFYKGKNILKLGAREMRAMRKNVQLIFQDPYSSLNPRIPIGEAIMEPMVVHGIGSSHHDREARVVELLEKVGLKQEYFYRYPHEFSGGQRQRIVIARALALEPELIICDESVSALDVSVQAQVLNLLNKLKREFGLTYIFISHDLSVVRFMSDRIAVMRNGKIEELAEADTLYDHPKSDYTRSLIASIPEGL